MLREKRILSLGRMDYRSLGVGKWIAEKVYERLLSLR